MYRRGKGGGVSGSRLHSKILREREREREREEEVIVVRYSKSSRFVGFGMRKSFNGRR